MTQTEYIAILFADCGYDTAAKRKDWLYNRFMKYHADELNSREASTAISALKEEKQGIPGRFVSSEVVGSEVCWLHAGKLQAHRDWLHGFKAFCATFEAKYGRAATKRDNYGVLGQR